MQINLGYVGNPLTLLDIYSHNLTYKEFSKYDNNKGIDLLTERIKLNFKNFQKVLKYNYDVNHINGETIKTQLTEETFNNKFILRPIPLQWLNSLSNVSELTNNPGW